MKFITCLIVAVSMLLSFDTKADLVRGHIQLEESERLWTPGWMMSWLELEEYLAEGFQVEKIDNNFLEKFIKEKHFSGPVIDPQAYLTSETQAALQKIIERHAKLSNLPLRVLVCGSEQSFVMTIPSLYERVWKRKKGVLLVYYLDHPLNATGYVSLGEVGEVSQLEIRELFSKSGRKANEYGETDEQLIVCAEEVSKRLYWIEKEYKVKPSTGSSSGITDGQKDEAGVASGRDSKAPDGIKQRVDSWKESLLSVGAWVLPSLIAFVAICVLWAIWLIIRKSRPLSYPDRSIKPRLGAENGALTGEIIKFKKINESISDQRNDLRVSDL